MISKSLFSKFAVVWFCLVSSVFSVGAQIRLLQRDEVTENFKTLLDFMHRCYDDKITPGLSVYHYLYPSFYHANVKKVIRGFFLANINWLPIEKVCYDLPIALLESNDPVIREVGIYIMDLAIDPRIPSDSNHNEESFDDCVDFDISKEDELKFLNNCFNLAFDADVNVRRAVYDFLYGQISDHIELYDSNTEAFDKVINVGLNDQDAFIRGCALGSKLCVMKRRSSCSDNDFDLFKKIVYEKNLPSYFHAINGLTYIAQLGLFEKEIFNIATDLFEHGAEKDVETLFICGLIDNISEAMIPAVKDLLYSADTKRQVLGCLIYSNIFYRHEKYCINSSWKSLHSRCQELIEKNLVIPYSHNSYSEDIWDRYVLVLFEKVKINSSDDLNKSKQIESRLTEIYRKGACKSLHEIHYYEGALEYSYEDEMPGETDLKKIADKALKYLDSSEIELQYEGLCFLKQLVEKGLFIEEAVQGLKKSVTSLSHKNICINFVKLFKSLVKQNIQAKDIDIIEKDVIGKMDLTKCNYDSDKILLKFWVKLAERPEFFNSCLKLLSLYQVWGGGFSYANLFNDYFLGNLVRTAIKSDHNLNKLREFAESCIKDYECFGSLALGIDIYEDLIRKNVCLNECVAFIKYVRANCSEGIHNWLWSLYDSLIEKDFAVDEAIEYANFLTNRNDEKFLPQAASLLDRLVSKGYARQEAFDFLDKVKGSEDKDLIDSCEFLRKRLNNDIDAGEGAKQNGIDDQNFTLAVSKQESQYGSEYIVSEIKPKNSSFQLGAVNQELQDCGNLVGSEIGRVWNPPTSVPKGTMCSIKFVLDNAGKVEKYETIQKSNTVIYDLSIVRIIRLLKFPERLWGKTFVVKFCQ